MTLPTDVDMVDETLRLKSLLGADALRDCDGTDTSLRIRLMKGFHTQQLKVNTLDDPKRWWEENPRVDVVRFTTFFHQFTLTFDDQKREKYVEWFGYSASVSPYILEQFEKWAGYPFRPEYIVDEGYHNSIFRCPSKEFLDFVEFQQIEVGKLAKEPVDIVHSYGKEAMMFLGDHWIGTEGGDPDRESLNVVKTKIGKNYYEDSLHNFWRIFLFIDDAICLEKVENSQNLYDSGAAFGGFQRMLADYPADALHETIPLFHHTPSRFRDFKKAVADDPLGRARSDTRLNNILFDAKTRKALCIIDLDTVMPGLSLYDFGDSIRFGTSTGAEDERDLSKIELDLSLYEAFTCGFLEGSANSLTPLETALLPTGAKLMTYECGIRFLADFLVGDAYFKTHRENQNLDRARTQFKLVADMERKWKDMADIVKRLS